MYGVMSSALIEHCVLHSEAVAIFVFDPLWQRSVLYLLEIKKLIIKLYFNSGFHDLFVTVFE